MVRVLHKWLFNLLISGVILGLVSCNGGGGSSNNVTPSNLKAITSFSFSGYPNSPGIIDITNNAILVTIPASAKVDDLIAIFTTNPVNATVKVGNTIQVSNVTSNNFQNPISYTVYAADGSTQNYTVTVQLEPIFSCIPDVKTNDSCACLQQNDASESRPIWYRYSSTDKYSFESANSSFISDFNAESFCGYSDWRVPSVFTNAPVSFGNGGNSATGDFIQLGNYALANGYVAGNNLAVWLNQNGFDNIESGSNISWYWSNNISTVTNNAWALAMFVGLVNPGPTISSNTAYVLPVRGGYPKSIITFVLPNAVSTTIANESIGIVVPYGTSLSSLIAAFTTNPANAVVKVGNTTQISGVTANDFRTAVIYTVYGADGSIRNYTVTVVVQPEFFTCSPDGTDPCACLSQNDESQLMWYRYNSTTVYSFDAANSSFIEGFNSDNYGNGHCGYNDWRIPSIVTTGGGYFGESGGVSGDFGSLGNYAIANGYSPYQPAPANDMSLWLNQNGFGDGGARNIQSGYYWSSSTYPDVCGFDPIPCAWAANFSIGSVSLGPNESTNQVWVLPVRN